MTVVEKYSKLQQHWKILSERHKLDVQIPFLVELNNNNSILAEVLLSGYGAAKGMLLFTDDADIQQHRDAIIKKGYGYSCMEVNEDKLGSSEALEKILQDWGRTKGI